MAFKPFKWIKKHPLEAAAIVALAGTGLGAAGIGPMAGLFAGEGVAAAGAGGAASGLAGTGAAGGSALLGMGGLEGMSSALLGPEMAMGMPEVFGLGGMAGTGATPFAAGAQTAASGAGGLFGPSTTAAKAGWNMTPEKALLLSRFAGLGQQPQQQPNLGGPVDMGNPIMRPAMATQDAITKKWLLQNDPATYARLYGQVPQGVV